MSVVGHLRALLWKELLQLAKDPKMRITIFVPPILMIIIFGYASTMDLKDCTFAVLDEAHTSETRELTARLDASAVFRRKSDFTDERDMRRRLAESDVRMGIVFPTNFTRSRQIEVVVDGRNSSSAGMAVGYANRILAEGNLAVGSPKVIVRGWYNPDYRAQWFAVPCLLANLLLIAVTILVALSLAREREDGTMDQLHLTPYTPFEILFVKGVSGFAIGVIQTTIALTLILNLFHVPFTGNLFALAALLGSFLISAVGVGLLVSVNSTNLQQAAITTMLIVLPLMMLSGATTPVACMPTAFQWFAMVNPMRYAMDALQMLFLEGAGFAEVGFPIAYIALYGLIMFSLAWHQFRKM
ncbi:MAG: ABC transporter permease [Kiritimatiellia bacterium]